MKIKNIAIPIVISVFCLTAAPVFTHTDTVWAAKGGISVRSAPRTAPAMTKPAGNTGNASRQTPKPEAGTTNTRQQARTNTNGAGAAATSQTSRWGNTLRSIGFLAGGMFLGSMLAGLLGGGSMGILSTILGLFMNLLLFMALIAAVRWLWRKIRGTNSSADASYRRGYEAAMRDKNNRHSYTIDVTPMDDTENKKHDKKS